jgi:hypothetical protein
MTKNQGPRKRRIPVTDPIKTAVEALEELRALNSHRDSYSDYTMLIDRALNSLRAAPETVSLEGVKTVDDLTEMIDHWKENTDLDTHDLVEGVIGYFGLPQPVAPVQPSAVVSRAVDIIKDLYLGDDGQAWDEAEKFLESIRETEFLQKAGMIAPQPVTTVQGGGVDYPTVSVVWQGERFDLKPCPFCGNHKQDWITVEGPHVYCHDCGTKGPLGPQRDPPEAWNNRAHLTPTQSAPSVGIAPTRKEVENAFDIGVALDSDSRWPGYKRTLIVNQFMRLLPSRTEGKQRQSAGKS